MTDQEEEFLREMLLQKGALVEVVVLDTAYEDWVSAVSGIVDEGWPASLTRNDETVPVSVSPEMFSDDIAYNFQVDVGRQIWTTQFYSTDVVDFQGSPEQLENGSDVADLRGFMATIHRATKKPVRLIPESIEVETVTPYFEIPEVAFCT